MCYNLWCASSHNSYGYTFMSIAIKKLAQSGCYSLFDYVQSEVENVVRDIVFEYTAL